MRALQRRCCAGTRERTVAGERCANGMRAHGCALGIKFQRRCANFRFARCWARAPARRPPCTFASTEHRSLTPTVLVTTATALMGGAVHRTAWCATFVHGRTVLHARCSCVACDFERWCMHPPRGALQRVLFITQWVLLNGFSRTAFVTFGASFNERTFQRNAGRYIVQHLLQLLRRTFCTAPRRTFERLLKRLLTASFNGGFCGFCSTFQHLLQRLLQAAFAAFAGNFCRTVTFNTELFSKTFNGTTLLTRKSFKTPCFCTNVRSRCRCTTCERRNGRSIRP